MVIWLPSARHVIGQLWHQWSVMDYWTNTRICKIWIYSQRGTQSVFSHIQFLDLCSYMKQARLAHVFSSTCFHAENSKRSRLEWSKVCYLSWWVVPRKPSTMGIYNLQFLGVITCGNLHSSRFWGPKVVHSMVKPIVIVYHEMNWHQHLS